MRKHRQSCVGIFIETLNCLLQFSSTHSSKDPLLHIFILKNTSGLLLLKLITRANPTINSPRKKIKEDQYVLKEVKLFACCSLLVTFCQLLVTFFSLLVTFCLLLVTFCSLHVTFCSLLVTFFSLLVTFCSLLVTFCSFLVTFCSLLVTFCLLLGKKF